MLGQVERMSFQRIIVGEAHSSKPLPKMVEKFERERGHEMGNRKAHKDKSNTLT
jgi:hypothetical protein